MARTREKFKARRDSGWFLRVPIEVLDSPAYRGLSFKARALLFDLGAQFRGRNNGDLAAPWSWMRQRGWRSKDTLQRAVVELQQSGMIELTRQGGLHCPNLYAFTWLPINECSGKLDVPASRVASGKWRRPSAPEGQRGNQNATPIIGAHRPNDRGRDQLLNPDLRGAAPRSADLTSEL